MKTEEVGLPEFYGIQQCFRLPGRLAKSAWRQKYARTAAFSEFDLWKNAPNEPAQTSLTWVLHNGSLQQLPAVKEMVGCRTRYGGTLDTRRSGGHLDALEHNGPYQARRLWTSDDGLILRTSADGKWSTGLYWERTTHLSDHHSADCLHASANIGGVAPHAQRVLRGKIYLAGWSRQKGGRALAQGFPRCQVMCAPRAQVCAERAVLRLKRHRCWGDRAKNSAGCQSFSSSSLRAPLRRR